MARPKASKWRPRASALGGYLLCDYRAAFDRAIEEGLFALPADAAEEVAEMKTSSAYADFGTCVHFHLQDGLRCQFPGKPADHAPDEEQRLNAALLHGGDLEATELAIRECATLAAKHLPASPDGKNWLAEAAFKTAMLQGHIDFLSQDFSTIVDLKTTSRPPDHNRPKPEHLVQMCAYHILVRDVTGVAPRWGILLYVDSKSTWVLQIPVDFATDEMKDYLKHIESYAKYLRTKALMEQAVPRVGKHCSDTWCPYRSICKEQILPAAGILVSGDRAVQPKMNIVGIA